MVRTAEVKKKSDLINHLDALFQDWWENICKVYSTEKINEIFCTPELLRGGFISSMETELLNHHEITHIEMTCSGKEISSTRCDSRISKDQHGFTTTTNICEALDEKCPFTFLVEKGKVCGYARAIMEVVP